MGSGGGVIYNCFWYSAVVGESVRTQCSKLPNIHVKAKLNGFISRRTLLRARPR